MPRVEDNGSMVENLHLLVAELPRGDSLHFDKGMERELYAPLFFYVKVGRLLRGRLRLRNEYLLYHSADGWDAAH